MHFTGAGMLCSKGKAKCANLTGLEKGLSDTCCVIIYGDGTACQLNAAAKQAAWFPMEEITVSWLK